jgi:hypothetical protein
MPTQPPAWARRSEEWTRIGFVPEEAVEQIVLSNRRVARAVGLPELPVKEPLPSGKIPDFRAPGVVGDAKSQVSASDGPEQLEGYMTECETNWPDGRPWRGVLVQCDPAMAPNARERLEDSEYSDRISVYEVHWTRWLRRPRVVQLYPEPAAG